LVSLLPLFEWVGHLEVSRTIQGSRWIYPVDQALHLVALAVFFGALLIVDLRLLDRGFREHPVATVARSAEPWLLGGLLALLITGVPQVMSTALKSYYSDWFWWKMDALLLAFLFTFTVRRWVALADERRVAPAWQKAVGLCSIALWGCVAVLARLIGLFS
jgi:putative copper export protein